VRISDFWALVDERGPDDCWPWIGSLRDNGYGQFPLGSRNRWVYAHRFALILTSGTEGNCTLHSCDNPVCCNPAHLRWGTRVDNAADAVARKRQPQGSARANARLTETSVARARAARAAGRTVTALAREYGVSMSTMSVALSGKTWRTP